MFAARLAECARALAPYVDWVLEDVLAGAPGAPGLDRRGGAAGAVGGDGLAGRGLAGRGVTPTRWWATRQGEIAAAYVAGILSLEDAAEVVACAAGR